MRRFALAMVATLAPAVFGAMVLAYLLGRQAGMFSGGVFLLGVLCGMVMLGVSRSRRGAVIGTSAAMGVLAVALTYVFNAKWNTELRAAAQLEATHHLEPAIARMQAKTMFGNASWGELLRANWHPFWLVAALAAALGAGLTIRSSLIGRFLRVSSREEKTFHGI